MSKQAYDLESFMQKIKDKNPHEDVFHQAVRDVVDDLIPVINDTPDYQNQSLLERLCEPERVVSFRIAWERDNGDIQVNRGYRVQFNGAIGPYKGGLRFHPSVTPAVLKFLGFEQSFKNALTGLPLGGGKGGSDFDPSDCSEREIRRFCGAFMQELYRHIGPGRDIPAGDINVGAREIGFLFGAYRRITGDFEGSLTGKGTSYGGSHMRTEATGHGLIYFLCHMLSERDEGFDGKSIAISGAGNVATYAAEKAIDLGAKVISLSDSKGCIHDKDGFDKEKIAWVREHKAKAGASLEAYADKFKAKWHADETPWTLECDIALPCATQNELDEKAAKSLADKGCKIIAEGANMPSTAKARKVIAERGIVFGPAKAANAGGVAVSGLEISQNRARRSWDCDDVADDLRAIMKDIHDRCVDEGTTKNTINYARGANIASFKTLAAAMLAQGIS